ncbi:MAG: hypothetical protein AAB507_00280 [Patescibacteria group bacterium]
MIKKTKLRIEAVRLRKHGKTYSEILDIVPVAKSTLSVWLKNVGLAKAQKQRITKKKLEAQTKAADAKRQKRIERQNLVYETVKEDFGKMSLRDLWICGVMLYWAEGTKEKEYRPGVGIQFSNSDHRMILLFRLWLYKVIKISPKSLIYELYVHKDSEIRVNMIKSYWSEKLEINKNEIAQYFKNSNIKTNRKNKDDNYVGLVRIKVRASSELNRKIEGWVRSITKYWGIV